jgi:hypothetical protein
MLLNEEVCAGITMRHIYMKMDELSAIYENIPGVND